LSAAEIVDVLVVGAGPAGLLAAREAASRGASVQVLEEHQEIGLPTHCAGLLSVRGLERIGVVPERRFVQNEISGANFRSPGGLTFTVRSRGTAAYVVDRSAFDKSLAVAAARAGARIRLGFAARSLSADRESLAVRDGGGEEFRGRVVIEAEGSSPSLAASSGVSLVDPRDALPAVQFEVHRVSEDPGLVDIYVGQGYAPGFFAWVIPTGEDTARVGLACRSGSPLEALRRIVRERLGDPQVLGVRAGRVLTCGPVSKSFARGLMAVGDAAGQAKPSTGGGVVTGGICARIAGRVAAEAVARNDASEGVMRSYDSEWRTVLGREFAAMSRARRVFDRLTDGTVDRLFRVVLEEELYREAEAAGDIDFQGLVLRRLARNPKVVAVLPSVLKDLVFR